MVSITSLNNHIEETIKRIQHLPDSSLEPLRRYFPEQCFTECLATLSALCYIAQDTPKDVELADTLNTASHATVPSTHHVDAEVSTAWLRLAHHSDTANYISRLITEKQDGNTWILSPFIVVKNGAWWDESCDDLLHAVGTINEKFCRVSFPAEYLTEDIPLLEAVIAP